jgi:hypothetical protein
MQKKEREVECVENKGTDSHACINFNSSVHKLFWYSLF